MIEKSVHGASGHGVHLKFILKEMKGGRSGVSLRAAIGARTEVRRGRGPAFISSRR